MCTSFGSTLDLDAVRHKGGATFKLPEVSLPPWRSLALLALAGGTLYGGGAVLAWVVTHPVKASIIRRGVRALWWLV